MKKLKNKRQTECWKQLRIKRCECKINKWIGSVGEFSQKLYRNLIKISLKALKDSIFIW